MSEPFHNPYQFIPADTRKAKAKTPYPDAKALEVSTNRYVRHDYWGQEGVSGRILCTLETVSPVVVGMEQTQGNKKEGTVGTVEPYRDREGNPAIPGNSLRGMIGSIAETISQSSLRVLVPAKRGEYSVRKPAQAENMGVEFAPLKKIGLLCVQEDGSYRLYPLADEALGLKAIRRVGDYLDKGDNPELAARWREETRELRKQACYQHRHHAKLAAFHDHPSGVYHIRGENKALGKRREHFLPWDGVIHDNRLLDVREGTVATLETMLRTLSDAVKDPDERTKKHREMLPKGYANHPRGWEKGDATPLVLDGDLLYYRTEGREVVELSYSSIWRKAIDGDLHSAFREHTGTDSLPWNNGRDSLTPAEALFGVVEDEPQEQQRGGARNLASRVRFTDAIAASLVGLLEPVVLKILNSPKPPSPALYFSGNGHYIAKTELDLNRHKPNGRKHYLPHPRSMGADPKRDWATGQDEADREYRPHMRLGCEPIPTGTVFQFCIRFENLGQAELGLLLTALQPDQAGGTFVHRLGLGKPLGLGHVRLTSKVETIDRVNRYSLQGLRQQRYQAWAGKPDPGLVDAAALAQLCLLGNPANVKHPVCYPFDGRSGQSAYGESRSFKWFGENDRAAQHARHQAMPTPKPGKPLPTLKS